MSKRELWPVDPEGNPIPPRAQPGYYPGYSTLSQRNYWDDATRRTVMSRVEDIPPIRFFSPDEAELLAVVADRALPQDDRDDAHQIPIVPFIDERLAEDRIDGYRYEGMPPDGEAHKLGLRGIEACAEAMFGRPFRALPPAEQEAVLKTIHDGKPADGHDIWKRMPVHRYWMLLLHDLCMVYYAHPWAWDEIGFGGPAYPRGYMRLENGEPEPWEVEEQRYDWEAPPSSQSAKHELVAGLANHYGSPGQGGTH
jgi:hypothetical protein